MFNIKKTKKEVHVGIGGAIKDPLSETAGALTHKQVTGDLNRSRGFPWAPPMYTREENQYAVGWGYMHHPFHL